jgi:hypothetical protein
MNPGVDESAIEVGYQNVPAHEKASAGRARNGDGLVASRSGNRQETAFEQAAPRLTRRVREEEASERLDEVLIL